MDTKIIKINRNHDFKDIKSQLKLFADIIKSGGSVAFPTETVYGLGADANNPEAIKKVFKAKGRPQDNPLIVHIKDKEDIYNWGKDFSDKGIKLMNKFWPGPITFIVKKKANVSSIITGGLDTVAIRVPADIIARAFISASCTALVAPSANKSGRPSPTEFSHVNTDLFGEIEGIIDGGESTYLGIESTVVDITEDIPIILRPGSITKEMIESEIGFVKIDRNLSKKPKSPGMKYKHYAPNADMVIVNGQDLDVIEYINKSIESDFKNNIISGIITFEENKDEFKQGIIKYIGKFNDYELISRNLFKILREFNETDVQKIYVQGLENKGLGYSIMNRLNKAAGDNIINL